MHISADARRQSDYKISGNLKAFFLRRSTLLDGFLNTTIPTINLNVETVEYKSNTAEAESAIRYFAVSSRSVIHVFLSVQIPWQ